MNGDRLGVFGGAFDPIHSGHLHLARQCAKSLALDKIILIPSFLPPHKRLSYGASSADRLSMCRLAVESDQLFCVSDMEISRGGISYTADTLREIKSRQPGCKLFLLMGTDMFLTVQDWYDFKGIAENAVLCTASRNPGEKEKLLRHAKSLEKMDAAVHVEETEPLCVSSTQIRDIIKQNNGAGEFLQQGVIDYIKAKGLYI